MQLHIFFRSTSIFLKTLKSEKFEIFQFKIFEKSLMRRLNVSGYLMAFGSFFEA